MRRPARFDKAALVQYRLEQAKDTLRDAHVLYEHSRTPVSVVNRAYYAIFYAVTALMASLEQEAYKHSRVIAIFDKEFVKTGVFPKEMSRILHEAFKARQEGDYRDSSKIDREKALEILRSADEFVSTVERKLSKQP